MSRNMTQCPDCGTDFDTIDQVVSLPTQVLQQECPSCGYTVQVSILNYPTKFIVIAPALDGDTCMQCGSNADIRSQEIGWGIESFCDEHTPLHYESSLDQRSEL
jgi:rRNA maturation protein Nop10